MQQPKSFVKLDSSCRQISKFIQAFKTETLSLRKSLFKHKQS